MPVLKPEHPRDPDFQAALRGAGTGLLPGGRLRRAAAAVGARHPAARLGQPALLAAAGLAGRRSGAARDLGRRRGHRGDHVPDRQGARRRTRLRRDDRAGPSDRHRRRPARAARRRVAPSSSSPPSTASRTATSEPASNPRKGSAWPPRSSSRTPRSPGPSRLRRSTGRIRACTPAPGAWTTLAGERFKVGPVLIEADVEALPAGQLRVEKNAVHVGTGTPPVRLGEVKAFGKKQMAGRRLGARRAGDVGGTVRRRWLSRRPGGPPGSNGRVSTRPAGRRTTCCARSREQDAYTNLVLPPLLRARGLTRPRRRLRHRAGLRHAPAPGDLRRGHRRLRRPAAGQGRRRRARRAPARHPPAAGHAGADARRRRHHRRPGARQGRAPSSRVRQRGAAQGRPSRPRRLGPPVGARPGHRPGRLRRRRARAPALGRRGASPRRSATAPRSSRRCWPPTTTRPGSPWWRGRGWRRVAELVAAGGVASERVRRTPSRSPAATLARSPPSPRAAPGVQDEGSQLVALALAAGTARRRDVRWLDLCAGPGGKSALLAAARRPARCPAAGRRAAAAPRRAGAHRHRSRAIGTGGRGDRRRHPPGVGAGRPSTGCWSTRPAPGWARCVAGPRRGGAESRRPRRPGPAPGRAARHGARRGAARWRGRLRDLLPGARRDARRGRRQSLERRPDVHLEDATPHLPGIDDAAGPLPGTVQLWPHRHGTDAMFLALLRPH